MTAVADRRGITTEVVTPALYDARVTHSRRGAVDHSFSYPIYQWLVDLDALPVLPWWLAPFARFDARDHLGDPTRSIRSNVDRFLETQGVDLRGGRIVMLANARVAGYVFNPISVHWCHDPAGALVCIVAEVHNTYGERHAYLLHPDESGRAEVDKAFYVSPFFTVDGRYLMRFSVPGHSLSVTMALRQDDATPFTATLRGVRRPVSARSVLTTVLRRPFMPLVVSARIRVQGIGLWLRRIPVVRRPPHVPQEGVQ